MTATITFDTRVGNSFVGRLVTEASAAGIPSDEATSNRVYSAASFDNIWFDPVALAQFQPQQVLDTDPTTGQIITFVGISGTPPSSSSRAAPTKPRASTTSTPEC